MSVTLRQATDADAPGIAQVQVASWQSSYGAIVPAAFLEQMTVAGQTERWAEWLRLPRVQTVVAEMDGEIVGFASGGPAREPEAEFDAEMYAIYLLQLWQRRGVGERMVRALSARLTEQGCRGLRVWVLEANPAAQFYRRLGGVEHGRKQVQLGEASLPEISFGWSDLRTLLRT